MALLFLFVFVLHCAYQVTITALSPFTAWINVTIFLCVTLDFLLVSWPYLQWILVTDGTGDWLSDNNCSLTLNTHKSATAAVKTEQSVKYPARCNENRFKIQRLYKTNCRVKACLLTQATLTQRVLTLDTIIHVGYYISNKSNVLELTRISCSGPAAARATSSVLGV